MSSRRADDSPSSNQHETDEQSDIAPTTELGSRVVATCRPSGKAAGEPPEPDLHPYAVADFIERRVHDAVRTRGDGNVRLAGSARAALQRVWRDLYLPAVAAGCPTRWAAELRGARKKQQQLEAPLVGRAELAGNEHVSAYAPVGSGYARGD